MKRPRLAITVLATIALSGHLLFSKQATASSLKSPVENQEEKKASLVLNAGYASADNANIEGVSFYEAGAGLNFALNENFSVTAQVSQGLLTSNFGTGFTSLGMGIEYSLLGSNTLKQQQVSLENYSVFDLQGRPNSSLAVSINARQVFFNGSDQVYPFTGVGACAKYRPFVTATGYWGVDLCYDYLLNPPNSTSMFRAMLGWSVFLF
ncbi:MAG: hypothetical protein HRT45_03925 [Bdellovibrionales bacterium]|nr:hypothetical protein [Bdellovibrionales bacterium]